jgi:hypothetical protein
VLASIVSIPRVLSGQASSSYTVVQPGLARALRASLTITTRLAGRFLITWIGKHASSPP